MLVRGRGVGPVFVQGEGVFAAGGSPILGGTRSASYTRDGGVGGVMLGGPALLTFAVGLFAVSDRQ